jgi:hypothetical protein
MSQEEFDTLARTLAETRTRRQALKALAGGLLMAVAGGALAALAPSQAEAVPCAKIGQLCSQTPGYRPCCPPGECVQVGLEGTFECVHRA